MTIRIPEVDSIEKEKVSHVNLELPLPDLLRFEIEKMSKVAKRHSYYTLEIRELIPNLYRESGVGQKEKTYH